MEERRERSPARCWAALWVPAELAWVSDWLLQGLQQRGTAAAVLLNGSASAQGLGEMPLDTPSAKGRRSQTSGVGHSRSSSTSRDALNTTDR